MCTVLVRVSGQYFSVNDVTVAFPSNLEMKEDLDYVSGFVLTKIFASNLRNNLFIFIFPEDTGRGDETQGFQRGDMTCSGPKGCDYAVRAEIELQSGESGALFLFTT